MKKVIKHLEEELAEWQIQFDHDTKMFQDLTGSPMQNMYKPKETEDTVREYEKAIEILKQISKNHIDCKNHGMLTTHYQGKMYCMDCREEIK